MSAKRKAKPKTAVEHVAAVASPDLSPPDISLAAERARAALWLVNVAVLDDIEMTWHVAALARPNTSDADLRDWLLRIGLDATAEALKACEDEVERYRAALFAQQPVKGAAA